MTETALATDMRLPTLTRCEHYRRMFGLHAELEWGSPDRIVMPIGVDVGALVTSSDLGRRALPMLGPSGVAIPIVDHPRSGRWTFLTAAGWMPPDLAERLARLGTHVAEHGQLVVLPSPTDEQTHFRSWIQQPFARQLPLLEVVAETLCHAGQVAIKSSAGGNHAY